jgi:hypothetical protein
MSRKGYVVRWRERAEISSKKIRSEMSGEDEGQAFITAAMKPTSIEFGGEQYGNIQEPITA